MKQVTVRGIELMYDEDSDADAPSNFPAVLDVINNALQDARLCSQPQITITNPDDPLDITIKDLDDAEEAEEE